MSTQLWNVQVGRLGEWQWQQKRLEGHSLRWSWKDLVIAIVKEEKGNERKEAKMRAVIGWLLQETDLRQRCECRLVGDCLLKQHLCGNKGSRVIKSRG